MGIFSFLNRDQEIVVPDPTPTAAQEEDRLKGRLPDLRREMSVDIIDENEDVELSGVITALKGREMSLGRHPGGLSFKIYEEGAEVMVQGRDSRMEQFYLRAVVAESSRIHIKLKNLEQEIRENHRDNFRLALNVPISVYSYADERMQRPEECILVDISTGGCCISSEYLHGEGEVLRLKIKLQDYATMNLVGEIIRVTEHKRNDIRCGILFAQLTEDENEALTKMLFNLQTGNLHAHGRVSKLGHW